MYPGQTTPIAPGAPAAAPPGTAPATKQGSIFTSTNLPGIPAVEATNLPVPQPNVTAPAVVTNTVTPAPAPK